MAKRANKKAAQQELSQETAQQLKATANAVAAKPVEVRFAFVKPGAKRVSLCGEFNRWSFSETPMNQGKDGSWEAAVALEPGRYQYKFLVDGEWVPDPAAQQNVPNAYGSLNSVIDVLA